MAFFADKTAPWPERLRLVVDMMREMSEQTEPEAMVRAYGRRISEILPYDRFVALSRRGLERPCVRVTRTNLWSQPVNPGRNRRGCPCWIAAYSRS